ncbi:MAG: hypothetical protein HRU20_29175 [Pseudomonadales bacterium]|nr:hypothetical protein [Pseudomonadales bacterium]
MKYGIFISALTFSLASCGGSDDNSSNVDRSFNYDCSIESNGFQGCWISSTCAIAESGSISTKLIFEALSENIVRKSVIYTNDNCSGEPEINLMEDADLAYSIDSTVTSSEGLETDLYSIGGGFTLVSIENSSMCFSDGFYSVSNSHDLFFVSKQEASITVNFENCLERI